MAGKGADLLNALEANCSHINCFNFGTFSGIGTNGIVGLSGGGLRSMLLKLTMDEIVLPFIGVGMNHGGLKR